MGGPWRRTTSFKRPGKGEVSEQKKGESGRKRKKSSGLQVNSFLEGSKRDLEQKTRGGRKEEGKIVTS